MRRFRIIETVEYELEANDEEEAESLFLDSEDRIQWMVGVTDRDVEEI